jgi:hypothetical protein
MAPRRATHVTFSIVRALVRDLHADDRSRSSVGRAGGLYNPPEQARARIGSDRLLQRLEAEQ